jgi:hypothetical protein
MTNRRDPSWLAPTINGIRDVYELERHWFLPVIWIAHLIAVPWMLFLVNYTPLTWFVFIIAGVLWASVLDHTGDLPLRRERIWARTALLLAPCFAMWITLLGPWWAFWIPGIGWVTAFWATVFCALPFWIAWSHNRHVLLRVNAYRNILAWDAASVDMRGVSAPPETAVTDGEVTEVDLIPEIGGKWTLKKMRARIPNIAARWGVPENKITITPKAQEKGRSFRARLRIDESIRPPEATLYQLPDAPTDIREPYKQGNLTGGAMLMGEQYRKGHGAVDGLTGGDRGSGKTKKRQRDAAQTVTSFNAMLWIADLKPGSPNWRDWAGLADWYATDAETFANMLRVAWAASFSPTRTREETHDPGGYDPDGVYRGDPHVTILLDECAIAFNPNQMQITVTAREKMTAENAAMEIVAVTKQFSQVSRSTSHSLLFSTVRLDFSSFGKDPAIRAFVASGERAGFKTARAADGRFLFAHDAAPDLSGLPSDAPGTGWFESYLHPDAVQGRADMFVSNLKDPSTPPGMVDTHVEQLYAFTARYPQCFPRYSDETLACIRKQVGSIYDERPRYTRDGEIEPVVIDEDTGEITQGRADHGVPAPEAPSGPAVTGTTTPGRTLACPKCGGDDITTKIADEALPGGDTVFECRTCQALSTWTEVATASAAAGVFDSPTGHVPGPIDAPIDDEEDPVPDPDEQYAPTGEPLPPTVNLPRSPRRAESAQHSRQMVWDALHGIGRWAKTPEIAQVLEKDPETVRLRLSELAKQGRVEQQGRNAARRSIAVGSPDDPVK